MGWGTHCGNELTHKSSGNARPQSSRLAEPLWSKGVKLVLGGSSPLFKKGKEKSKSRAGNDSPLIILAYTEKSTTRGGNVGHLSLGHLIQISACRADITERHSYSYTVACLAPVRTHTHTRKWKRTRQRKRRVQTWNRRSNVITSPSTHPP